MTLQPVRPDPDELLKQVQAEEQSYQRGRLKIFLGYAAGVGKTYAMLEELEILPRKQVEYHHVMLSELDVDAILHRRPQLVLVDEFAHTNARGSRHPKRYQDVEEILDAGADVYTTLNIQHLESLNDVVAQMTGVTVRETVPDRVIDEASEVEVIDLPPDELLTEPGVGYRIRV
jgi:two-component system, OmpR family, sensor histidine kinase KdpD